MSPQKHPTNTEPKKAVLYLRVSSTAQTKTATDIDKDGNSIATQRELTEHKAYELGATVVKEFAEPGMSAQTITKRKQFKAMMAYLKDHPGIDYVIIYARSRAFRNFTDAAITRRALEELGIRLISVRENFGEGIQAEAMEAITDIMNQMDNQLSGEDIRIKMLNKAKNGGTLGRAHIGYLNVTKDIEGYKVNTVVVDPERAPLIKRAFELYASGLYTVSAIAEELESQGLRSRRTPKLSPKPLHRSQVHALLKDPYYLGMVTYKGEIYQGRHEPLIEQSLFDRVQEIMAERSGAGMRERVHHHYLKGLLRCMKCKQKNVTSRLIFTETKGKSGAAHEYYFCAAQQRDKSCDLGYLPVWLVEERVVDVLDQLPITEQFLDDLFDRLEAAVHDEQKGVALARNRLLDELAQIERKETRLIDALTDGILSKDQAREKMNVITLVKAKIQSRMEGVNEQLALGVRVLREASQLLNDPKEYYKNSSDGHRRIMLQTYFESIDVGADPGYAGSIREPFASIVAANREYSFPQAVVETTMSAESRQACPTDRNGESASRSPKLSQNAILGHSDHENDQKESDAGFPAPPLSYSLAGYYRDDCSNNSILVGLTRFELATS